MQAVAVEQPPHVARAIRRRMLQRGLNYRSLALKAGLAETYVRDLMRGKSKNPKHQYLVAIATALNCSILDLIDPELSSRELTASEVVDKPDERALLALYRAYSPADRQNMFLRMIAEAGGDKPDWVGDKRNNV